MRKRRFLFSTLFLAGAAVALGLSACNRPTPENNSNPDTQEKSHQELMFNTLLDTRNLDADLDVNIIYRDYEFDISGKAYVTLDTISDIKANLDLTVNMPHEESFKEQTLKATYLNSTFYPLFVNAKVRKKPALIKPKRAFFIKFTRKC